MAQWFQQNNHTSVLAATPGITHASSASVTNQNPNPWHARVIILLEPLSHQSTDGSVVPTVAVAGGHEGCGHGGRGGSGQLW